MTGAFELAVANLTSPMVLFFGLGLLAAFLRSDLEVPQAAAKFLAIYLMMAIGFKGGAGVAAHGVDALLIATLLAGVVLSFVIPFLAFAALRATSALPREDVAAVAAHYGSISVVTFAVATDQLAAAGLDYEGFMVATAAAMETPAIIAGLLLARNAMSNGGGAQAAPPFELGSNSTSMGGAPREVAPRGEVLREVAFNGSIVILLGAFAIGWITGGEGLETMAPFIVDPFRGVLAIFLLDMGLIAGRGLRRGFRDIGPGVIAFGLYMPLVSAAIALAASMALGLSVGGTAIFMTLSASASYIAVPAAMRLALPEARPAIYLTLSLGITFPFNLALGIPLYIWAAQSFIG